MMNKFAPQLITSSPVRIVTAPSNTSLKMREDRKQRPEVSQISTSVFLMFSLSILNLKASLSEMKELTEISLRLMIYRENSCLELLKSKL
jgi:hypothetical protein